MQTTLTFKILIRADQKIVFDFIADWEKQSQWILFTNVKQLRKTDKTIGSTLLATTGFGPLKLTDTMVITEWQPAEAITIEHTGRVILGKGRFSVRRIDAHTSEFIWREITPVPFGWLGNFGFIFLKPIIGLFFNASLRRLKTILEK